MRESRDRQAPPPAPDGEPDVESDHAFGQLTTMKQARRLRRMWRMLPSAPRCKVCNGPFRGPFTPILRAVGKGRWPNNPHYCGGCFRELMAHHDGAEIESSFLFADVRGSTEMAERMRPSEMRELMDRFFSVAADRIIEQEGIIDKFVGDEIVAIFIPGLTGGEHAAKAIAAGRNLLRVTAPGGELPLPIGIGINTGTAYVGAVGTADRVELTAVGDPVNVAARLASAAGAGELLASASTMRAAHLDPETGEHRSLRLKGKSKPVEVAVLR